MILYLTLGAIWAVLYALFIIAGIRAGWAWRRTYALSAERLARHAAFWGALASVAGFGAVSVGVGL